MLRPALLLALPALLCAAEPLPVPAIPFNPKHYVCQRATTPPKVDGKLDDPVWQLAAWTEDFQDIEGFLKPKPRFRTRAKLLWDDTHLYIAAEMEEPNVWGTLTQKDGVIFHDNDFEVFLDPEGSTWPYYEFEMNALNTMWDLMVRHPYRDAERVAVNGWDCAGLRSAVAVQGTLNAPRDQDRGWTVELAIPLASVTELATRGLTLPPGADGTGRGLPRAGDTWRLNFSRVEWQTEVKDGKTVKVKKADGSPLPEDNWVWSPTGLVAIHYPEMWGFLHFSSRPAGSEEPRPELSPADHANWGLRRIYYAQRNFHAKHGRYAASTKELDLAKVLPEGWSLWMEAGERQWMAEAKQGRTSVTIDTRGAVVWKR